MITWENPGENFESKILDQERKSENNPSPGSESNSLNEFPRKNGSGLFATVLENNPKIPDSSCSGPFV